MPQFDFEKLFFCSDPDFDLNARLDPAKYTPSESTFYASPNFKSVNAHKMALNVKSEVKVKVTIGFCQSNTHLFKSATFFKIWSRLTKLSQYDLE